MFAGACCLAQDAAPAATPPPTPPPPLEQQPEAAEAEHADAGREAVVVLKDGQRFNGFLVQRLPDRTVLRIAGIDTPIRNTLIDRVEVLPPVLDRYRQMRSVIDDTDVDRLLLLAEWLRVRAEWDLALEEIDQVLAVSPGHPDGERMRLLVISQRELAHRPKTDRPGGEGAGPALPPDPQANFPLLSPREINLIKVYEIDLKNPPRIVIPREVVDQLLQMYKGDRRVPQTPEEQAMLYRSSPTRVLDLMFRLRARELYERVQVVDQPRSMRLFRDDVHRTWIMNSCATARCHGGAEAGRLQLYTKRPNTEPTVYTNFIILDRYRLPDGTQLINYDEPADSPLLQMGLPREPSTHPHPLVPSLDGRGDLWRPFFRSKDDFRFQQAVEWIKSMYRPRPDYPIDYRPPTPEAITPDPDEVPVFR
jgi:hypothetical protein